MSDVTVDMTDEVGWARFGLVQDLRTLRDAGQVRWHDGHLQLQPELLDVVRYALEETVDPTNPVRQSTQERKHP